MSDKEASEEAVIFDKAGDDDDEKDSANELSPSNRTESEPEDYDAAADEQVLRDEEDDIEEYDILPDSVDIKHDDDDDYYEYADDGIPWHHMQLYRLYGDEADYFLHLTPSVKREKRVGIKPTRMLRKLCGECSADEMGRNSCFSSFLTFDRMMVQILGTSAAWVALEI